MTGWAPTTDSVIDKGFGGSRGSYGITGAVIHHVAGTNGRLYVANANDRNSHPTYHVDSAGRSTGIVHPSKRPYSTSGSPDAEAISFEIDNSAVGGSWPVTDAALSEVVDIIVWHAMQSSRKGQGFAKNIRGQVQREFFIAWHSQYDATACPGPHILSKMDWIVAECRRRYDAIVNPPKPPVTPPPAKPVWTALPAPLTLLSAESVPVLDLVTGKNVGTAIAAGKTVGNLVQETTWNGKRYYRTKYSVDKGFDRGLLASSFVPVPPPAPVLYTVVFDDTPDDPTSDYVKVVVEEGKIVSAPTPAPTREGFIFKGWYNGAVAHDFTKPVTSGLIITAMWEPVEVPEPEPEPEDPEKIPNWFIRFVQSIIEALTKFLSPKP